MTNYFEKAKEYKDQLIENRRSLHQMPETGLSLPNTKKFVMEKLKALGLEVKELGESGLSVLIEGEKGDGKCILVRADMDALPMKEESGLSFSATGDKAHTCGHDLHAAIAISAAEMFIKEKKNFKGKIKIMFQPAEEIFEGSKMMIEEGILENPKVDVAIALHTALDEEPGSVEYNEGYFTTSCDNFKIKIKGKGGHGAYPHTTIDPINAAFNIYQNFMELVGREAPPQETVTLTFGMMSAGSNSNIIPETAELQGTLRTYSPEVRKNLKARMQDIVDGVMKTTRSEINLDFFAGVPSLLSDPKLTAELVGYIKKTNPELKLIPNMQIMASEDMALVAEKVPTTYFMLNSKVEGNNFSHHNPGVEFNEDALPIGLGLIVTSAIDWLNNN